MKTTKIENPPHCPQCFTLLEFADSVGCNRGPKARDITVCIKCAAVLQFTKNLRVRECPPDELGALKQPEREAVEEIVRIIRERRAVR